MIGAIFLDLFLREVNDSVLGVMLNETIGEAGEDIQTEEDVTKLEESHCEFTEINMY